MSFLLGVWDAERPPRVAEAKRRYEQLLGGEDPLEAPSPRISALVEECDRRWTGDDAGGSPPCTTRRTPSGLLAAIAPEAASALYGEWAEMAERHGVVLYDPQSGIIKIPSRLSFDAQPPAAKRGWFGRR